MKATTPHRPQLTSEELLQLRWLLGGIVALIAVGGVVSLDVVKWPLTLLVAAGLLAVLVKPTLPGRVPSWTHRLAFPVIVAVFAADLWTTRDALPAMIRLALLLLGYRGITYRKKRDDLQVMLLGLFLVVVTGVLTVSLAFAAQILVFVAGSLGFLLLITLTEEGGDGAGLPGGASASPTRGRDVTPSWARRVQWRRLATRVGHATDWRVGVLVGLLFMGLVGVSALLFLAIPRFQLNNSFFLERFISKKTKTGFNDTIHFGDVTDIQQDNSVALSVDVTDRSRIPASPYWRMLVLDEYREGSFRLSAQLRRAGFSAEQTRRSVEGTRPAAEPSVLWTCYLEAGVSRYLPLLGAFQSVLFQEPQNWRVAPALGVVALRNEPPTMIAYRVSGMETGGRLKDPDFAARWKAGAAASRRQALMLQLSLDESDRAQLDRVNLEIKAGRAYPADEYGRRVTAWLGRRHGYSLQPVFPSGNGDPLVRWLVDTGGGHCELFAGSLVLLARAAGVPARVVTGFRGGSWNGYSNNFTLRNSDAHAWCELFDEASGSWLRVDPTPGATSVSGDEPLGEAALARRMDRSWTARFDSLRMFWYRRIVNFDQQSQLETLKTVKAATENSGQRLRAWFERSAREIKGWLAAPWTVRRAVRGLAGMAFLAAAIWALRAIRWPTSGSFRGSGWWRSPEVRVQAGHWLRKINERPDLSSAPLRMELQRLRFGPAQTRRDPRHIFREARVLCRRKTGPAAKTT